KAGRYHDAVRILEACQGQSLGNEEVTALLEYARSEEVDHTRELHKRSTLESAQNLINEGSYDEAIAFLQSALAQSDDPTLRLLLEQATTARTSVLQQVDTALRSAVGLVASNRSDDASRLLKSLPKVAQRSSRAAAAIAVLDEEKDRA